MVAQCDMNTKIISKSNDLIAAATLIIIFWQLWNRVSVPKKKKRTLSGNYAPGRQIPVFATTELENPYDFWL